MTELSAALQHHIDSLGVDVAADIDPSLLARLDQMHTGVRADANRLIDEFVGPVLAAHGIHAAVAATNAQITQDLEEDNRAGFAAVLAVMLAEARRAAA